jgi:hypothetical protein
MGFDKILSKPVTTAHARTGDCAYTYFLKHRTTGEIIELGYTPVLTEEQIQKHSLAPATWNENWEFCCKKESA